jgi:hypothetical protein
MSAPARTRKPKHPRPHFVLVSDAAGTMKLEIDRDKITPAWSAVFARLSLLAVDMVIVRGPHEGEPAPDAAITRESITDEQFANLLLVARSACAFCDAPQDLDVASEMIARVNAYRAAVHS